MSVPANCYKHPEVITAQCPNQLAVPTKGSLQLVPEVSLSCLLLLTTSTGSGSLSAQQCQSSG